MVRDAESSAPGSGPEFESRECATGEVSFRCEGEKKQVSSEDNKETVRRLNEAFNRKDMETIMACYADDAVHHEPFTDPKDFVGKEEIRRYFAGSFEWFPDEVVRIDRLFADGNWVFGLWNCQGTQTGEFIGLPPTKRRFDVDECAAIEFDDEGKIKNFWVFVDSGTIIKQLGFTFAPARASGRT